MQIAKHDLMRNTNTLIILECIMKHGPIAKWEIQARTGLSWGSISSITFAQVDELFCEGEFNSFLERLF